MDRGSATDGGQGREGGKVGEGRNAGGNPGTDRGTRNSCGRCFQKGVKRWSTAAVEHWGGDRKLAHLDIRGRDYDGFGRSDGHRSDGRDERVV